MSYSHRHRDRYRLAVTAVTGVGTAGALTATGWLVGVSAQDFADQQAAKAAKEAKAAKAWAKKYARQQAKYAKAQAAAATTLKQRPYVTRTTTQYVQAAPVSAAPGSGGAVAPVSSSGGAVAPTSSAPASAPAQRRPGSRPGRAGPRARRPGARSGSAPAAPAAGTEQRFLT